MHFTIVAKGSHVSDIIVVEINGKIVACSIGSSVTAFDIHKMFGFQNLLC